MKKALLLTISLCLLLTACSSKNVNFSELDKETQEIYIMTMAENEIESMLKSPSTAKFPSYSKWNFRAIDNLTYEASSYVDAQNSFGGMLRNNFTIKIQVDDDYSKEHDGYGYKVLDIEFK